ncbi:MAG: hypothetical protein J6Y27_04250 [Bacteroidales bacterium]|nr:hypothetical protein [Bacteroidales bacterium]
MKEKCIVVLLLFCLSHGFISCSNEIRKGQLEAEEMVFGLEGGMQWNELIGSRYNEFFIDGIQYNGKFYMNAGLYDEGGNSFAVEGMTVTVFQDHSMKVVVSSSDSPRTWRIDLNSFLDYYSLTVRQE